MFLQFSGSLNKNNLYQDNDKSGILYFIDLNSMPIEVLSLKIILLHDIPSIIKNIKLKL